MISAWRYATGETTRTDVDLGDLVSPARSGTLLVIDVADPRPEEVERVASVLGLHHLAVEDLTHSGQRTKLEHYADHRHIVVHDLSFDDGDRFLDGEIDIVFGEGWLLTVRHGRDSRPPVSLDVAFERFERRRDEHGPDDEGFALWAVLDLVVDNYFLLLDAIDERLDSIEERIFAETSESILTQEIFDLRRVLLGFRRAAAPLRDVVGALLRREAPEIGDQAIVHLQDVFDHVLRVLDLLESQRELLSGLLEAQLSMASNRMNRVMKATSSWGAILVVNTLITGIYGMNFRHMPELGNQFGYPGALLLMAIATFVLYRSFKRRGWL